MPHCGSGGHPRTSARRAAAMKLRHLQRSGDVATRMDADERGAGPSDVAQCCFCDVGGGCGDIGDG